MQNRGTIPSVEGVEVIGAMGAGYAEILTPEALAFVASLARAFEGRRQELLERRVARQAEIDAGILPDFLPETREIRAGDWTVAPVPADLQDRRVEITGPVDRKMIINALNCGAKVFMADFEDANAPTWANNIEGSSGENTPLVLMWLTVVWLLATMPAAALHHAIDLGALFGKRPVETGVVADASIGQWAFFAAVALAIAGGGGLLYGMPTVAAFALATSALAGLLTLGKRVQSISRSQTRYQTHPQLAR